MNFTFIPKINEAFAKPLYVMDANRDYHEIGFRSHHHHYSEVTNNEHDTDVSVMDVTSESDSSSDTSMTSESSFVSVMSTNNIVYDQ